MCTVCRCECEEIPRKWRENQWMQREKIKEEKTFRMVRRKLSERRGSV
jgi:hypothetical protein